MDKLLQDAIADAKAVRETALANAKLALEEAFTPHLKSMLSKKLQAEIEGEDEESDEGDEVEESAEETNEEAVEETTEETVEEEKEDAVDEEYSDEDDEDEEMPAEEDGMEDEDAEMEEEVGDEPEMDHMEAEEDDDEMAKMQKELDNLRKQLAEFEGGMEKAVERESEERLRKMGFREETGLVAPQLSALGTDGTTPIVKSETSGDTVDQLANLSYGELRTLQMKIQAGDTNGVPKELL